MLWGGEKREAHRAMKERAYASLKMAVKVVCNERGGGDGVVSREAVEGTEGRSFVVARSCNFVVTVQRQWRCARAFDLTPLPRDVVLRNIIIRRGTERSWQNKDSSKLKVSWRAISF